MLHITTTALVIFMLTATLCLDLVSSGILFLVRGMRPVGTAMLALGTLLACLPLTVLARFTYIPAAIYGVLLMTSIAVYLTYRMDRRRAERETDGNGDRKDASRTVPASNMFWIENIVNLMGATGRDSIRFDPDEFKDAPSLLQTPWCRTLGGMIESVSLVPSFIGDAPRADTIEIACVINGNAVRRDFYGTEDEDFDSLFHHIYAVVTDLGCEDPEEYLERASCIRRLRHGHDSVLGAEYNPVDRCVTVTVRPGALGEGKTGGPIREVTYTLSPDQGYWSGMHQTDSDKYETVGMFDGNKDIHPDIIDSPDFEPEEPEWLRLVLEACDEADFTPYCIRITTER